MYESLNESHTEMRNSIDLLNRRLRLFCVVRVHFSSQRGHDIYGRRVRI
jgi:hypothetical protein